MAIFNSVKIVLGSTLEVVKGYKPIILARAALHRNSVKTLSGSAHKHLDLRQSLGYIDRVFTEYLFYAGLTEDDIRGKRILEVGPGDNLGVALKFVSKGAGKIVCLDRFYSERDDSQQVEIYKAMLEAMTEKERSRVKKVITFTNGKINFDETKIEYIYGVSLEKAYTKLPKESFHFIISRAVLEHIFDSDQAFESMHRMLTGKGLLIHKVDLRDHGMFSDHGMSELEFLTIPGFIWKYISPHKGKTNRNRVDFYREKLSGLNYAFKNYITHIVGSKEDIIPHKLFIEKGVDYNQDHVALVLDIKPRLVSRFRSLSINDLLITGIFLIARKP